MIEGLSRGDKLVNPYLHELHSIWVNIVNPYIKEGLCRGINRVNPYTVVPLL
jgi:hypothetical protein